MSEQVDLAQVTPEQFSRLVKAASDDDIATQIHAIGTKTVLDRVFEGMQERFASHKAKDLEADVQWILTDQGEEHPYVASIHNGSCEVRAGRADDPRTSLTMDLVTFCRLIVGQENGPQLFMKGRLKVGGDLMFAQRVETLFDRP